jgi:Domain of unknown function (DUF4430)
VTSLLRLAAAAATAAAAAGCGLGAGSKSAGTATLTITRDYGTRRLATAAESDPASSETVLRFLDRNVQITTRYGGGFVQSIDGIAGNETGGRRFDWFFYVNGIESPVGATQVAVRGSDRIWWDYRDWTDAMRVPAVVGSWPQPFTAAGRRAAIACQGARPACATVRSRLREAGLRPSHGGADAPRLLVGPWGRIRRDPAAAELAAGPQESGVFARFVSAGGASFTLELLDARAQVVRRAGAATGLLAAVRDGEEPPTWLVTGVGAAGVRAAARRLDSRDLRDRYAVAATPGRGIALPLGAGSGE